MLGLVNERPVDIEDMDFLIRQYSCTMRQVWETVYTSTRPFRVTF